MIENETPTNIGERKNPEIEEKTPEKGNNKINKEIKHPEIEEMPLQQRNNNSKKRLIIIGVVIGIILVAAIIVLCIVLRKGKDKDKDIDKCEENCYVSGNDNTTDNEDHNIIGPGTNNNTIDPEKNIKFKKLLKYSYSNNKTNVLTLSDELFKYKSNGGRTNNTFSYPSSEEQYKITVYFYNNDSSNYYGYAFIENFNFSNFKKEDKNINYYLKENFPIVNFTLSKDGKIIEKSFSKGIDRKENLEILINFLNEINENEEFKSNIKNKNNNKYEETEVPLLNDIATKKTKRNLTFNDDNEIISLNKEISYKLKRKTSSSDIETDEGSVFQPLDFQSDDNIRKGIIKDYKINSEIKMSLLSNEFNENNEIEINNFLPNIEFDDYEKVKNTIEEKLNNKKKNNNIEENNNNLKKRNLEIASFHTPVQFSYSLFKIDLGSQDTIGLGASVGFFPMNSTVVIKLIFKENDKKTVILELYNNTNNFGDIADEVNEVYTKIYLVIVKNVNSLFGNFEILKEQIVSNITTIVNEIKNVIEIREAFKIGLEDINEISKNKTIEGFNNCYSLANYIDSFLNSLSSINLVITSIDSISNEAIQSLLELEKNNLNQIYTLTNDFYNDIINEIKNKNESNTEIILDIETFYAIREQLDEVEDFYYNFQNTFKTYIQKTTNSYSEFINEEFNEKIEENLSKNELMALEAQINPIIIDNINIEARNNFVNMVQSFRNKINTLLDNIKNSISTILNNSSENQLNNLYNDYNTNLVNFKNKKDEIMSELERIIKVNTNFTLYINDLKVLYDIERELQNKRIETFNDILVYKIDHLENIYASNIISNFKEQLNISLNTYIETNFDALKESVNDTIQNLGENLIENITNEYKEKAKTILEHEILPQLLEITDKYETEFYQKHFLNNYNSYISPPFEITFKFQLIVEKAKKNRDITVKQVNSLLKKYIKYTYNETYHTINETLKSKYNLITKEMSKLNINIDKDLLNQKFQDLYDEINNDKINNLPDFTKEDPFDLNEDIIYFENEIIYKTWEIEHKTSQVEMGYKFCFFEATCPPILLENLPTKLTIYNYQIAKIRSDISDFKNEILSSENIINDDNIGNFYFEEYINEFNEGTDFNYDKIITNINEFLNNEKEKEEQILQPYLGSIKQILKDAFNSNLNIDKIISTFEIVSENIFNIPKSFILERSNEVWKGENEIKRIFVRKIEDYMNYEKTYGFFFNESEFINVYKTFENKIKEKYNTLYDRISNSFTLNDSVLNYLITYEEDIIYNGYNTIKDYLKEIANISPKIELLNNFFSVSDIDTSEIDDLYNEIKSNYANQFKNIGSDKYNSTIKKEILLLLNESQDILLERLEDEKVILVTYLTTHNLEVITNNNSLIINNMSDYEDSLIKAFEDFYNNYELLFSNNNITKILLENAKNHSNELNLTFSFDDYSSKIMEKIGEIIDSVSLMYNIQKKTFSKLMNELIEESFTDIISSYSENDGYNYYDAVIDQDFLNNIYPKLSYIDQAINDTKEYTTLLFSAKNISDNESFIKNVSEYINKTFCTIYTESKEIIKNNTENKVESFIYKKLDEITETLSNNIINLFSEKILSLFKTDEFKNNLNEKIINLLPKEFSNTLIQKLKKQYLNLTNDLILIRLKDDFKEQLTEELAIIYNHLDELQKNTTNIVNKLNSFQVDESMKNINNIYNTYDNEIEKHKILKIDEETDKNIKGNITSLMTSINDQLDPMYKSFNEKIEEGKNAIEETIKKEIKFAENFEKNLDSKNKINNSKNSYENISSIVNSVLTYSQNLFSNFVQKAKDQSATEEVENPIKLRNLEEFNHYLINGALEEFKNVYETFSKKILQIKEYIELSSSRNNFISKTNSEINDIESYINSTYLYLNKTYPSEELDNYFSNINDDVESIKILSNQFLRNESLIIDKIMYLIRDNITQIYPSIKDDFRKDVEDALKELIPIALKKINKIENRRENNFNDIEISSENNEILSKITGKVNNISYSSYFSFDSTNDTILFEGNISANADGNINNEIDIFSEKINGTLGNGVIGIKVNYSVYDEKAYATAYAKLNQTYYDTSFSLDQNYEGLNYFEGLDNNDIIKRTSVPFEMEYQKQY